ncbi:MULTISPECIES: GTP-binding protein [Vibrio]|uniref:CobW family GTP-binding protein n=1 Tax=Vibrio TaxID=662 RepID=UPI0001540A76|nr:MULTISPECIES: GTP-binding protein [Vibrio]EDL54519.1 putative cobalamin synthesis protein [Vibrio mediterranei AK1]MCF4172861.1 GTP-binding protein [Vibrio sp. McD22-P3]MCG9663585.1 GTP-binding protein [Vibrio mediterranei]MCG9789063.1 GTP-binding protein [Vibrio mediterranei]MCY9853502.1 GTP-binding protein [Vibrio mediterranei]
MSNQVPTNIITGFLGVGKTTTILNLLKSKPENENWAVLVNEFGEVGIDGAMMAEGGALIKEVPGGCMCCTAGVPMSVGINVLLRQKPDRLIIEPTGLGHPKQVIKTLTSEQYTDYIDLKATIALVDPRNLSDDRHLSNANFNDQLSVAEVVIGNKVDQCTAEDVDVFNDWVTDQTPAKIFHKLVKNGVLPIEVLDIERRIQETESSAHSHDFHDHSDLEPVFELSPEKPFIRRENQGQGYFSCGWIVGAEHTFDFDQLFSMFSDLNAERIKAVVNTDKGCYAFNVANRVVSVNQMSLEGYESRIEVIDSELLPWEQLETVLLRLCGLR